MNGSYIWGSLPQSLVRRGFSIDGAFVSCATSLCYPLELRFFLILEEFVFSSSKSGSRDSVLVGERPTRQKPGFQIPACRGRGVTTRRRSGRLGAWCTGTWCSTSVYGDGPGEVGVLLCVHGLVLVHLDAGAVWFDYSYDDSDSPEAEAGGGEAWVE